MAFPGNRLWKLSRPIKATSIFGTLSHDGCFVLTEADFPDAAKTAGGEQAIASGGADIALSTDEFGANQIPCQVVRCDLDSNPANSRIEVWFRRQDVSDTLDTSLWIWWGDSAESQPAVTANYGRNDVWNGVTGTGTPPTHDAVWHLDEQSSDPAPEYIDSSGNGHHVTSSTGDSGDPIRVDASTYGCAAGRGQQRTGDDWYGEIASPFGNADRACALVSFVRRSTTPTDACGVIRGAAGTFGTVKVVDSGTTDPLSVQWASTVRTKTGFTDGAAHFYGFRRLTDGNGTLYCDTSATNSTGWTGAMGADWTHISGGDYWGSTGDTLFGIWALSCAPNDAWFRAVYECVFQHSAFYDRTSGIEATAVPTTVTIHCVDAGTLADIVGARVYVETDAGGGIDAGEELLNDVTDANGEIPFVLPIADPQPITGVSRKGTATPFYKQGLVLATINPGIHVTLTVPMVRDE